MSNDNAYVESLFRTLKYDDQWPERYYHTRLQHGASGLNDTVLMLGVAPINSTQA